MPLIAGVDEEAVMPFVDVEACALIDARETKRDRKDFSSDCSSDKDDDVAEAEDSKSLGISRLIVSTSDLTRDISS